MEMDSSDSSSGPQPRPRPEPNPVPQLVLCPYCGGISRDALRCQHCRGRFDPLSRQATQNAMGPWWLRDEDSPFGPGCSYDTIRALVERGTIGPNTVLRGPTTNQFWTLAKRVPGVAHLLGMCHQCQQPARASDFLCSSCGAGFSCETDRQHLGVGSVQLLPGQAPAAIIAASSDRLGRIRPSVQAQPVRTTEIQPRQEQPLIAPGLTLRKPRRNHPLRTAALIGLVVAVAGGLVWLTLWATDVRPDARVASTPGQAGDQTAGRVPMRGDRAEQREDAGQRVPEIPAQDTASTGPGRGDQPGKAVSPRGDGADDSSPAWVGSVRGLLASGSVQDLDRALVELDGHSDAELRSAGLESVAEVLRRRAQRDRLRSLP